MLERVIDLARRGTEKLVGVRLLVATDDPRIGNHAQALGCDTIMTDPAIASGSGRALAAACAQPEPPRWIVNLQGDAPFLPPAAIREVLGALQAGAAVATPVARLSWAALDQLREHKQRAPFSGTTCIRGARGQALWFSKAIIPAIRNEAALRSAGPYSPVFRHLGLYGYTYQALAQFEAMAPSVHETLEGLEQLRFLDAEIAIQTVAVEEPALPISGIDTPEDAQLAERLIARFGDPFGA